MNKEEDSHQRTSDSLVHGMEGQCTHQYAREPMRAEGAKERLTAVLSYQLSARLVNAMSKYGRPHTFEILYYALADIILLGFDV